MRVGTMAVFGTPSLAGMGRTDVRPPRAWRPTEESHPGATGVGTGRTTRVRLLLCARGGPTCTKKSQAMGCHREWNGDVESSRVESSRVECLPIYGSILASSSSGLPLRDAVLLACLHDDF